MRISARVENAVGLHQAEVRTGDNVRSLVIPPKASGAGSSVNGGELLLLAIATCYCIDVYREAAKKGIDISKVVVQVEGEFGADGEPGRDISFSARVTSTASEESVRELLEATDRVAEIQNTLRTGTPVTLKQVEVLRLAGKA